MLNKIRSSLIGFRKFLVTLTILVITVWFRLANLIDGDNVADIFVGVGAAFMAANLIEHIREAIKENKKG